MLKKSRIFFILIFLCSVAYVSYILFKVNARRDVLKTDLIELSDIKYGLFNVDEWKTILSTLLISKIDEFDLNPVKKNELKNTISTFLTNTINEFEIRYNEEKSKTFRGKIEKNIARVTGTFQKIKDDVPVFTNQILGFISDNRNRNAVKKFLVDKLNTYVNNTFSKIDYSNYHAIINRYHQKNKENTLTYLRNEVEQSEKIIQHSEIFLICFVGALFLYMLFISSFYAIEFILFIITCAVLLSIGVWLPMIEIDARITDFTMELMGKKINFNNQVLYYQSKSILSVIHLMITQSAIDLRIVGILVCTFSLIFPFTKLITALFVIIKPRLHKNKVIDFLVFKTGKWSMADVMVIAIFMAYIGFTGIITEQLGQIEHLYESIQILTTNNSKIQAGFFAFTAFAVLGLLTAYKLQQQILKVKKNN